MDMNEIRKKNEKELRDEVAALRKEQFNLRMQAAAGQAPRAHQVRNARKDVARLKTALSERAKAGKK